MAEIRGNSDPTSADSSTLLGLFLLNSQADPASGGWAARFHFDAGQWYWSDRGRQFLSIVIDAILHNTVVEMDYSPRRGGPQQRQKIEPYGLVWKSGNCYVAGRLPTGEIRSFRMDRMAGAVATGRAFEPPAEPFDVRGWWERQMEEFGKGDTRVVLRGTGSASGRLRSLNLKSTSRLRQLDDGTVLVTLYVDTWDWLVPMACEFGGELEVVEPEALRSAVIDRLSDALRVYNRPALNS